MKKILLYVVAGVISASTVCFADTAGIKAACEQSDKLLWDARNEKCIPRNPCAEEYEGKYGRYCNRTFKDFQSGYGFDHYIELINIYASTHGLNCEAIPQSAKFFGQDYVVCQGTDVMVFEFDDIQDANVFNRFGYREKFLEALCAAGGGLMADTNKCKLSPNSVCITVGNTNLAKSAAISSVTSDTGCELILEETDNAPSGLPQTHDDALFMYDRVRG